MENTKQETRKTITAIHDRDDKVTIVTNHHFRDFLYYNELPENLKEDVSWIADSEEQVFERIAVYKGNAYPLSEFTRINNIPAFEGWHGYIADTFFSGVLIKISEDGDFYQIGFYFG